MLQGERSMEVCAGREAWFRQLYLLFLAEDVRQIEDRDIGDKD